MSALTDTVFSLKKKLSGSNSEPDLIAALRRLAELSLTLDVLTDTNIGVDVNHLRKHSNSEVARLARELVAAWKKLVPGPASSAPGAGASSVTPSAAATPAAAPAAPTSRGDPSRKPASAAAPRTPTSTPTNSARKPSAGAAAVESEDAMREKVKQLFLDALLGAFPSATGGASSSASSSSSAPSSAASSSSATAPAVASATQELSGSEAVFGSTSAAATAEAGAGADTADMGGPPEPETPPPPPEAIAAKIESELWSIHGNSKEYKARGRTLLLNLKDQSNPHLRVSILRGEVTPERLCRMTAQDMASKELKEQLQKLQAYYAREAVRGAIDKSAVCDHFKCSKCGQRKTTYFEMQTRSADEPMTCFITCLVCGNRWKQ